MFKFVVLCAFFAVAAAKPGALLYSAPLTQYSTIVAPGTTSISKQESSVIHPSADLAYTNVVAAPAPLVYSSAILPAGAPALHLIKKRSAPLLPTTYYAPQYYAQRAPILTTSYAAGPLYPSTHLISSPVTYTHLIKKRSAPLLSTYLAPTSYSHQSRYDLTSNAPLTSVAYSAPIAYSSLGYSTPLAYSHLY